MPTSNEEEIVREAVSRFREGFNCAESVVVTFAKYQKIRSNVIPKIASGFGGGIGRSGSVCGALSGAIMSIGMKYGRNIADDTKAYDKCVGKSRDCYVRFKKEFGSIFCNELTECDFTTEEGREKWRDLGLREKKCVKYIEGSMRILLSLTK
jgi:C_GCAxxG_C_C family probable redox protein